MVPEDDDEDGGPELVEPEGTVIAYWRPGYSLPGVAVVVTRPGFARVIVRPVDGEPYRLASKYEDDAMRIARQIAEGTGARGAKAAAYAERRTDGRVETEAQAPRTRETAGP